MAAAGSPRMGWNQDAKNNAVGIAINPIANCSGQEAS